MRTDDTENSHKDKNDRKKIALVEVVESVYLKVKITIKIQKREERWENERKRKVKL